MDGTSQDPVNGRLHLCGAMLATLGLTILASAAASCGSLRHALGLAVFGVTAVLMFSASALYHLSPLSPRRRVYRRLDHAMIYVFIAGTYTPICAIVLWDTPVGPTLLLAVWGLAVAGAVHKVVWFRAPRGLSTGLYLALGWIGALAAPTLVRTAPAGLLRWMLTGGILYTIGAIVFWARRPRGVPGVFGYHELWHVFVIAASASHYWAILAFVAPLG